MDAFEMLALIHQAMAVETAEDVPPQPKTDFTCPVPPAPVPAVTPLSLRNLSLEDLPITMAAMPGGRRIALLKTVLTSACERNCNYCCFRAGRDTRRTTFQPDELAGAFLDLHQRGLVEGIFLSSGMAGGGIRTEDRLIAAAEILRRLDFQGYIHLKIMPGAERDQVLRAMQLADRVSVNLEGPNPAALGQLAPQKVFMEELLQPLRWVEEFRRSQPAMDGWKGRWPSSATQFVVGAVGESDLELLQTAAYLHSQLRLRRVYYSRFKPTARTPFEDHPEVSPWRQHRLYQADFLLRDYGFSFEELPFTPSGSLPLDRDPKLAWAQVNLSETPLEINRAALPELLRLPGVGPLRAKAILSARRKGRITSVEQLRALDVTVARLTPFILLDGRRPSWQMSLF